ncbi:MAG: cupredoxin domain-containing protein [Nanoarchaeota archaeon]
MKKSIIIINLGIILLLAAGCSNQNNNAVQPSVNKDNTINNDNTIEITVSGFNPSSLTINAGETVTWINKGSSQAWPASAVHPTHKVYPETGGCIGSKFDACKSLKQGEAYSFTFNQKGTWRYHDHLNSGSIGTIIVQ